MSRENPERKTAVATQEAKKSPERSVEQLKKRELIDLALRKLEGIRNNASGDPKLKARIEHTLNAVRNAYKESAKNKNGKHKVEMKDATGNVRAVQEEGVPVDELINIIAAEARGIVKSKRDTVAQLKKKVKALDEKYKLEPEQIQKAIHYSELEDAKRSLLRHEKQLDEGGSWSREADALFALTRALNQKSQSYFEAHYSKGSAALSTEESNRQSVRTEWEANLRSQDYRASQNPDLQAAAKENYSGAMEDMNKRREITLEDEEQAAPAAPGKDTKKVVADTKDGDKAAAAAVKDNAKAAAVGDKNRSDKKAGGKEEPNLSGFTNPNTKTFFSVTDARTGKPPAPDKSENSDTGEKKPSLRERVQEKLAKAAGLVKETPASLSDIHKDITTPKWKTGPERQLPPWLGEKEIKDISPKELEEQLKLQEYLQKLRDIHDDITNP